MISELTQIILVVLTLFYVIFTYYLVKSSFKSVENQNRPYISFGIIFRRENQLYISIQNTGNRIAENVTIDTIPPLESNFLPEDQIKDKMYYPSIPPNYNYETSFDLTIKHESKNSPTKYEINIVYNFKKNKYSEHYYIDFSMLKRTGFFTSSEERENRISNIVKELKEINKTLENLK